MQMDNAKSPLFCLCGMAFLRADNLVCLAFWQSRRAVNYNTRQADFFLFSPRHGVSALLSSFEYSIALSRFADVH